jgi:hypothetical protein
MMPPRYRVAGFILIVLMVAVVILAHSPAINFAINFFGK